MNGKIASCYIQKADCSYQPGTNGQPTFCNDAPYPNNNFALVAWGSDWSDFDGKRIVVKGQVYLYNGKPQIEGIRRSQVAPFP